MLGQANHFLQFSAGKSDCTEKPGVGNRRTDFPVRFRLQPQRPTKNPGAFPNDRLVDILHNAGVPDGTGPRRIARVPADDVDVQLRHLVSERRDIDLLGLELVDQNPGRPLGFVEQVQRPVPWQVVEVAQSVDARHEDHPREPVVAHEKHAAEVQVAKEFAIRSQFFVKRERHRRHRFGKPPTQIGLDQARASLACLTRT